MADDKAFVVRHTNGSVASWHETLAAAEARAIQSNAYAEKNGLDARYVAGPA